jgi:hypothetical protein
MTYDTYYVYFTYLTYYAGLNVMAAWLDKCDSKIIYERWMQSQVLYVVPITSILGRLALVPVGETGTIPFSMRNERSDFPGATCDSKKTSGD